MISSRRPTCKRLSQILSLIAPWLSLLLEGRTTLAATSLIFEAASTFVLMRAILSDTLRPRVLGNEGAVIFAVIGLVALTSRILCARITGRSAEHRHMESYVRMISRRLSRDPKGLVGIGILAAFAFLALVAPFISSDPLFMDFTATLQPPSSTHLLGTDMYGRDIFSRIVFGTRYTLGIAVTATALNVILGATLGLITGYFRGVTDAVVMRILEIMNSIPFLMLAILIVAVFGSSTPMLILVLSIFVLQPTRIVRSQVLELRERDYVKAALALGASRTRIIFRHLLPNTVATLLVVTSIRVGQNILALAGLSFLGMGILPPTPSWGAMLQEGRAYILQAPWLGFFPGSAIFVVVLAFNLLGDSLRDALDPRLKL